MRVSVEHCSLGPKFHVSDELAPGKIREQPSLQIPLAAALYRCESVCRYIYLDRLSAFIKSVLGKNDLSVSENRSSHGRRIFDQFPPWPAHYAVKGSLTMATFAS